MTSLIRVWMVVITAILGLACMVFAIKQRENAASHHVQEVRFDAIMDSGGIHGDAIVLLLKRVNAIEAGLEGGADE